MPVWSVVALRFLSVAVQTLVWVWCVIATQTSRMKRDQADTPDLIDGLAQTQEVAGPLAETAFS